MTDAERREVYFEFVAIGNDGEGHRDRQRDRHEVSTMGPASASQADLQQLALRKLQRPGSARRISR